MKLVCALVFALIGHGWCGTDIENKQTAGAAMQAVMAAERKPVATADKEASAVADATMKVVESESLIGEEMPEAVMDRARNQAKKTFQELKDAKVDTAASADAAAKVAVAEVDGASGLVLDSDVKKNAEKAAVAAGKAVDDHPTAPMSAVLESMGEVTKEVSSDKVDLDKKKEGLVADTEDVVSDISAMPYDHTKLFLCLCLSALLAVLGMGYKSYRENNEVTPYMMKLRLIREEEDMAANGFYRNEMDVGCNSDYTEMA